MHHHQKFFKCSHCGNVVGLINNGGVPLHCCSEPMRELEANQAEATAEKHKPYVQCRGDKLRVEVGTEQHPMTEGHNIAWVYLQTARGGQRKSFVHSDSPEVEFSITADDRPEAVFSYCNQHGLWKTSADEFKQ